MSGLILELGLESELPLPSGPQITRRIGKSFAQLLTNKAVLIAVGVAWDGGGDGWAVCIGVVDARRRGGGSPQNESRGLEGWRGRWFSTPGSSWDGLCIAALGGLSDDEGAGGGCCCCVCPKVGRIGVEGYETSGVSVGGTWGVELSCFVRDGASIDAKRRTVIWWARVASAFKLRKKRYCTMIGARERDVLSMYGDFSIRAQVR